MGRQCIRATPNSAHRFAELLDTVSQRTAEVAAELRAVTTVENSHDAMESFCSIIANMSRTSGHLGPLLAMGKLTGGILGTDDDETNGNIPEDYDAVMDSEGIRNRKEKEQEPFELLRNLMNKETQDYPQAEA